MFNTRVILFFSVVVVVVVVVVVLIFLNPNKREKDCDYFAK